MSTTKSGAVGGAIPGCSSTIPTSNIGGELRDTDFAHGGKTSSVEGY